LQAYRDFFDDLADGFPFQAPLFSLGCSAPSDARFDRVLKVSDVGNYVASFVPTLSDFSRLDPRFNLPANVWSQIPQYANYGFAVFQLAAGSLRPHPMAFEFDTDNQSIFFPTMHIHDGEIHETEAFDHILYLQHAGLDSQVYGYQNYDIPDRSTELIRSKTIARNFCDIERTNGIVDADLLVHRKWIRGMGSNRDTEVGIYGDPTVPSLNLRPLIPNASWVVATAGLVWFIVRRAKIQRTKMRTNSNISQAIQNR
jgi:hypothetical protein